MVFGNLVENRICYKGDGGGDGAGSENVDRSNPAEMRAREQQFENRVIREFNQGKDEPDQLQVGSAQARDAFAGAVNRQLQEPDSQADRIRGLEDAALQRQVAEMPVRSMPPAGPPLTDRQMLAAPIPFAAQPERAPNNQAELVRQLVTNAAQQSLDQGGATQPVSAVMGPAGRQDPGSGFFADAFDVLNRPRLDDGFPDPNAAPVTAPGTALGTILGAGPVSGLFGGNTPDPADAAAFNVGQLERMGGVRDPQTGAITGATAGPGTLNMNRFGMVTYSGLNDPTYTGAFQNLVRGTTGLNGTESDRPSDNQMAMQPAATAEPMDPGTTTPEQIDDLAVNYLQNPFFLYSGQGNLFQPYGYAGNTLVDLLQTRNMQMPGQAAPNLGLFGNPRDFS